MNIFNTILQECKPLPNKVHHEENMSLHFDIYEHRSIFVFRQTKNHKFVATKEIGIQNVENYYKKRISS